MARMSEEERNKHIHLLEDTSGADGGLKWLYDPQPSLREVIERWVEEQHVLHAR